MADWLKQFFGGSEKMSLEEKSPNPNKGGALGQFDLWDWWCETFTDDERRYIIEKYTPFGNYPVGQSVLTHGNISIEHPRQFLSSTAMWFNNPSGFSIAKKFMDKAQTYSTSNFDVLTYHFDCYERIKFYYRWRDDIEGALDSAIQACRDQIDIAEKAAPVFLKDMGAYPSHTGYKQLAIILEKQGNYRDAIDLCNKGRSQGWSNDFDKRIERLEKKLN